MLDPGTNLSQENNNHLHFPSDNYGPINYKLRAQKTAQNYSTYQAWNSRNDFGAERRLIQDDDDDDSGVCSPPLWRSSSPQNRNGNYRSLSPSSRAQAIARGQKELMEMVSKMPEGCYELSLKDIVEQTRVGQDDQGVCVKEESFNKERSSTSSVISKEDVPIIRKRNVEKKVVNMNRSKSLENNRGFLIKMVFPIPWSSRNKNSSNNNKKVIIKKNDNSAGNNSGRVSPRPLLMDGSVGKGGENEWWKNRFVEKEESESSSGGGSSSNSGSSKSSGSSSGRSNSVNSSDRQRRGGCWSFIFSIRGKKTE